jgi:calcium/calmodulin-dependent protein kinase I
LLFASKDPEAIIKIADFGLARFFMSNELMMTQCGTPGYVAPEILEGKGYDNSVDFWSVGIILYILYIGKHSDLLSSTRLCGFPPFYDEDTLKLYELIKKAKVDFPSPYWDEVSDGRKPRLQRR